jgi:putative DNA primase/helicase
VEGIRVSAAPHASELTADDIGKALKGRRNSNGSWSCRCPAHNDKKPSLSVSEGRDGRVLVHCHGPCTQEAVFDALRRLGLWHEASSGPSASDFLRRMGERQRKSRKPEPEPEPEAETWGPWLEVNPPYDYTNRDGTLIFQVRRQERFNAAGEKQKQFPQRRPDGKGGWISGQGDRRVLYRWPELLQYPEGSVFICEGEKDADRIASLEFCATTVANGNWKGVDVTDLAGRDVWILEDADVAGKQKALGSANAIHGIAKTIRIVRLPGQEFTAEKHGKDVSDWLDEDPSRGTDELAEACRKAPLWQADTTLHRTAADELEMCGVDWLWPGRFALGKIGLIAGLPDYGKGQLAAFITAAVTGAIKLPCGEGSTPQGNVIWFNAEDDARDTVLPRLVAAGADPKRVHFVNGARVDGRDKSFSLVTDLPLLRQAIRQIGNVVLIIFDPMSAYLGVGKVNKGSATDVRGVLTPLKELVEELHVAMIGIAHFNKNVDVMSALLRVSDSIAYVAAARHVYAVLDDPEDKNSKLFVKAKNNVAADKKALRYGIGVKTVGHDAKLGVDIDAPFIVWHPQHVEVTANEAMEAAAGGGGYAKRAAREFLLDRLEDGPVKADDVLEEAKQNGIARNTLYRAKKDLRIRSRKTTANFDGAWTWELPATKKKPT